MRSNSSKGIISWFVHNPVAANLLLFSVIILGLASMGSLRKEAFPAMEPNSVTVSMVYDSGSAKQAEEGIAIKIEDALLTVSGIKRITSTSTPNGSTVRIEKNSNYDLDVLLNDIKVKVDSIYNFPSEAKRPVIDKGRMRDHALWVQLFGDADRKTLQQLADRLKADLLEKTAIRDVEIKGKSEPLISIEINEGQLQAYNLTLSDIAQAINAESHTSISTSLRNKEKVIRLNASEQAYTQKDFANIPLINHEDGAQLTLGDVATITDTFDDNPSILSHYNHKNGVGIEINMDAYGDVTEIIEQASEVVNDWHQRQLLPHNIELVTWYDKSTLITERLDLLSRNALSGIALVFIILALFLNIRVAFWVAAGLPFVFCGTLFFMGDSFAGLTINEMTTFGFIMALGIVVDDAVVIGESIYTTRLQDGDTVNNTIRGTLKVASPTIFGVLTTVAAFVALSNVDGMMGSLYSQFGGIVMICLLLSLVESKLILPAHLAHLNTQKKIKLGWKGAWSRLQNGADFGLQWFNQKIYKSTIIWAIKMRYAVVLGFITLFILVVSMPMTGAVRIAFFPEIMGDIVRADMTMQTDVSFGQTHNNLEFLATTANKADTQLRKGSKYTHSAITSLQVLSQQDRSGGITIELAKNAPYDAKEFEELWRKYSKVPEGVKKLKFNSGFGMGDHFRVELKAWDESTLIEAGEAIKLLLQTTPGVNGIDDNLSPNQPQLRFDLTQQGRSLGITTANLSRQILQLFGGEKVQRFQRNKDEVTVRVRYPEQARQNLHDVMQAKIRTPNGEVVALNTVVKITSDFQQDSITRINGLRAITISASVNKSIIASNELVDIIKRDLLPQLQNQYKDLSVHFAGEAEHQAETSESMGSMFMVALIGIYVLLAIPLRSYVQPIIIMTAIPFGIVGAILGHWLNGLTISILSLNGILALSGVVVNDSLLLVSRFNELSRKGMDLSKAITESCTGRLRAVLLTSITTFAGLAPLLSETSMQAQFLIPAAASLGYGILFATIITLILIPSLLMIKYDVVRLFSKGPLQVGRAVNLPLPPL